MIYVFCQRKSDSALELVKGLDASRIRRFDGMDFWGKTKRIKPKSGDVIICWGDSLEADLIEGVRILNGAPHQTKADQAAILTQNKINTIKVRTVAPPAADRALWIPRRNDHVGGNDILVPTDRPHFWSQRLNFKEEYRIHSFDGRSIRAGVKRPREGFANPHEWCRSFDGGWRIVYDNFQSNAKMRTVAHKAVKALGLTFGAVDIGLGEDGNFYVLEVNRAPGLEGGSIEAYVNTIKKWIEDDSKPAGTEGAEAAAANDQINRRERPQVREGHGAYRVFAEGRGRPVFQDVPRGAGRGAGVFANPIPEQAPAPRVAPAADQAPAPGDDIRAAARRIGTNQATGADVEAINRYLRSLNERLA